MSLQIEPEIRHLDREPLVLSCERCGKRATWFAVWSCCNHDNARCAEHASQLNTVVNAAVNAGDQWHTPCKSTITETSRLLWIAVGKR